VLGDGSYLLGTGAATLSSGTPRPYVPAQHLVVGSDAALTVTSVPGTAASSGTSGRSLAVPGPGGSVYLHGPAQDRDDIQRVALEGGVAVAGAFVRGPDAFPPGEYSTLGTSVAYDAERGLLWALDLAAYEGTAVKLVGAAGSVAGYSVPDFAVTSFGQPSVVVGVDGSLYVPIREVGNGPFGFERLAFEGIAPAVTTQPQDVAVDLASGEASRTVTFETAVDAELGGTLQWQVRLPGTTRFTDVEGATTPTLSVPASPATDGRTYRAVVTNDAGRVASDEADLTVTYAPRMTTEPRDVRVTAGANALFTAEVVGNPAIDTITWQRRVGGFWQDVEPDDQIVVDTVDGVTSLRLTGTETDQSGVRFRVRATSAAGTGYSRATTLTVEPKVVVPADGLSQDGVVLEWTGSAELQARPPFNASNYFSAGVSAGDQATYRAVDGDVEILQVSAGGSATRATWETRNDHVGGGEQRVRLDGGTAELEVDGSATVTWHGAWSVNFYGGLVPFTISDPELQVAADGTGTLVGDLSGYASSMDDPGVKAPITPVPDVTIATFAGVDIDPAGRVTVQPDYDGVELDVPADGTPQTRTGSDWGSWPQEFVDVHFTTGLSSYWYSSGGSADPLKRPAPFVVDFTDAVVVDRVPEPQPETPGQPQAPAVSTTSVELSRSVVPYGGKVGATVSVTAPGAVPTGAVTVRGKGWARTGTLAGGAVRITLPARLDVGRHELSVGYAGAAGVAASTAQARLQVVKAESRVRLQLPRKVSEDRRVRARVRVSVPAGIRPTGQVVVRDGRDVLAVGRLKPTDRGSILLRLPRLERGRHHLEASVAGSARQQPGTSAVRTVRVR
jgi:hypothetical protein